jgi:hypothetical protein
VESVRRLRYSLVLKAWRETVIENICSNITACACHHMLFEAIFFFVVYTALLFFVHAITPGRNL